MSPILLQRIDHQTETGLAYQHLHIQIATPDRLIEPQDLRQDLRPLQGHEDRMTGQHYEATLFKLVRTFLESCLNLKIDALVDRIQNRQNRLRNLPD